MIRLIENMRRMGDTVGGIVEGLARGVPAGWANRCSINSKRIWQKRC